MSEYKKYRETHIRASKNYYLKHKEEIKEKYREYAKNHREEKREYDKKRIRSIKKLKKEYERLLNIARKMHTWIFLHTGNEKEVYDELGLTDEENVLLGYGGQYILGDKE